MVCNALRSRGLLTDAGIRILADDGPPSGLSTTVAVTYEVLPREHSNRSSLPHSAHDAFLRSRGIARETFKALGGGEAFIKREREQFSGKTKK